MGGSGNNMLNGMGGDDTMSGGAGNDTYVVDNTGDVVEEAAGGGTEDACRPASPATPLGENVENTDLHRDRSFTGTGNDAQQRPARRGRQRHAGRRRRATTP